jgi:hypothetical protein
MRCASFKYGIVATCALYPTLGLGHAATSNTVLFDREVVRILDAHCVMCHVEGGASFPLETYEQNWLQRQSIHDTTLARHMPPWAAVPGYGEFANANRLTLREQRFIVSWVEGLGPRNTGAVFLNVLDPDAVSRPPIRARARFGTWMLGDPDREITLAAATVVPAGTDEPLRVQRTIIDLDLRADRWLAALEYLPASRRSTRAVVFTIEGTGQWLATWTPWHGFRRLPDGMAFRLAAGAKVSVAIHSIDPLEGGTEPGRIGLHFADGPGLAAPGDLELIAAAEVPGHVRQQRLRAETQLAADTTLLALWPALPTGVESIEVRATRPDGRIEVLLFAVDIPLDWPTPYIYTKPVELPRGTRLALTAYVANDDPLPTRKQVGLTLSAVER